MKNKDTSYKRDIQQQQQQILIHCSCQLRQTSHIDRLYVVKIDVFVFLLFIQFLILLTLMAFPIMSQCYRSLCTDVLCSMLHV